MKPKISVIVPLAPNRKSELKFIKDSVKKHKGKTILIYKEGFNPPKNRNIAIKKAKTPYLAFVNAHTTLTENWADEVLKFFKDHPEVDIVFGPQLTSENESLFGKISGYALASYFGAADASRRYKIDNEKFDVIDKDVSSANMVCRKEVLEKVQFDESLYPGEESKLIADAIALGFKTAYTPKIIAYQKRRDTTKDLAKQVFNYGRVRPLFESFITTLKKPIFLIPSLFLIYILFLPTLVFLNYLFLAPLILYIIISLVMGFITAIKNNEPNVVFLMPYIFFIIHFSYGIGFISGLVQKIKYANYFKHVKK